MTQEGVPTEEFLAEAQELVEGLGKVLMDLEAGLGGGPPDPDLLNAAFRATHTLKGLSGLAGRTNLTELAHLAEDVLDALRMGRLELSTQVLDALFEANETFGRCLTAIAEASDLPEDRLAETAAALTRLLEGDPAAGRKVRGQVDPEILAVLTEYEEHRLRTALDQGRRLWFVGLELDFEEVEAVLEALKRALKPEAEVISYLPATETTDANKLGLDILVAAGPDPSQLEHAVRALGKEASIRPVPLQADSTERASRPPTERRTPAPKAPSIEQDGASQPKLGAEEPADSSKESEASRLEPELTIRSITQTVRVDIRKLDALMNNVGELGMTLAELDGLLADLAGHLPRSQAHVLNKLRRSVTGSLARIREQVLDIRLVSLDRLFDRLARVVRKLARRSGKPIRFQVEGRDTELDKLLIEEIADPLLHLIRNAVDHGIEDPETRAALGKPEEGTITVSARQAGNHVVISVTDDGGGIDLERIRLRALELGLLEESKIDELTDREILGLLFEPGFTTRREASETSGRGVGLDVVKTNLARLSGIIEVETELGMGTRFTITLPVTLAITRVLLTRVGGQTYAVPLNSVLEALAVREDAFWNLGSRRVVDLRGTTLPILDLGEVFGHQPTAPQSGERFVIVVGLAQHRVGLVVDELSHQRDVVVRRLGRWLRDTPGIAGATILGSRKVVLVLDLASLVERFGQTPFDRKKTPNYYRPARAGNAAKE